MADFVKKTWSCGDNITADDLNRLEGGVEDALECCGSGNLNVVVDGNFTQADHTSIEIAEAVRNGQSVSLYYQYGDALTVLQLRYVDSNYVLFSTLNNPVNPDILVIHEDGTVNQALPD